MTTEAVTSSGIITKPLSELISDLTTSFKTIYGSDITVDTSSPDGQTINIYAQGGIDVRELIVETYNSFNPDTAVGVSLDQRAAINGIVRQGGTYTVTPITVVATQACVLYGLNQTVEDVFTISDDAGNNWKLQTTQTIATPGTNIYNFQAENPGAVTTTLNTITSQVTVVLGVSSVNNPTALTTLGIDEESDLQFRTRRSASVSLQSTGYFSSLQAALENINGVTNAKIYENDTDITDTNGVPPHSIWVIVAGSGTSADIAQAIYIKRNAGCGMLGNITYNISQVDGTLFPIYWDDVAYENIFIKFTAISLDEINVPDLATIKAGIPNLYIPSLYEEVNTTKLGTYVQSLDMNVMVSGAGFCSTCSGSFAINQHPSAKNNQFVISAANTIIIPMQLKSVNGQLKITSGNIDSSVSKIINAPETFTGLGGYGTLVYSLPVNASGGSIISSTGVYTAGGSSGTDIAQVTDALGNIAQCTITVTLV